MSIKLSLIGISALALSCFPALASAAVLVPGYTESTYASGLPAVVQIGQMTIDPSTGPLFYMTEGPSLYRLDTNRTVTTLGQVGDGNPYISTDIKFVNGSVYQAYINLHQFSTTTNAAASNVAVLPAGYSIESGLAQVGNRLYVTGGATVNPGQIQAYDLTTHLLSTPAFSVPAFASSMDYDAVHNRLIIASNNENAGDILLFGRSFD